MDKTCKSNGDLEVAIFPCHSGERVRNTWAIYREVGDNPEKSELIPDVALEWHHSKAKVGDRKA